MGWTGAATEALLGYMVRRLLRLPPEVEQIRPRPYQEGVGSSVYSCFLMGLSRLRCGGHGETWLGPQAKPYIMLVVALTGLARCGDELRLYG